jgi:UDP-N-acetylglucosamine 2-epimerase (non-hydrolysing)
MQGVLRAFRPDLVLVQGDTTTTFAAALAAFYERVPVAHVEAGLRTGNIHSPWPEEMNRRLAGAVATTHFAPTENARQNLLRENVAADHIHVTGNTVIDALMHIVAKLASDVSLRASLDTEFRCLDPAKRLILVTCHRRESFGEGLENICRALTVLGQRGDVEIVYPVHLNPNVREPVGRILAGVPSIHVLEPLDYLPFVYLMNRAFLVLTDSGGIQEEAPGLGKPVLVMRGTSERPEGIAAGTVRLVGTSLDSIVAETTRLLDQPAHYDMMSRSHNPYGYGHAAERIADACLALLAKGT